MAGRSSGWRRRCVTSRWSATPPHPRQLMQITPLPRPSGISRSSHPDFENGISGLVTGLVGATLPPDKKPIFVGASGAGAITDASTFAQWYNDVPDINKSTTLPLTLTETAPGSGIFEFNDPDYFPIDGVLFGNEGLSHNYHFTLELHTSFTYQPGQTFHCTADDDMWVYINNQLVVDLGGVHSPVSGSVALDTLGLTPGNTYDFDLYFAERNTVSSSFHIQTSIAFFPHPDFPRNGAELRRHRRRPLVLPDFFDLGSALRPPPAEAGEWRRSRSDHQGADPALPRGGDGGEGSHQCAGRATRAHAAQRQRSSAPPRGISEARALQAGAGTTATARDRSGHRGRAHAAGPRAGPHAGTRRKRQRHGCGRPADPGARRGRRASPSDPPPAYARR